MFLGNTFSIEFGLWQDYKYLIYIGRGGIEWAMYPPTAVYRHREGGESIGMPHDFKKFGPEKLRIL